MITDATYNTTTYMYTIYDFYLLLAILIPGEGGGAPKENGWGCSSEI